VYGQVGKKGRYYGRWMDMGKQEGYNGGKMGKEERRKGMMEGGCVRRKKEVFD